MVYEVISPRGRGTGNIVGVHTESPQCIDSLDMQKAEEVRLPLKEQKKNMRL